MPLLSVPLESNTLAQVEARAEAAGRSVDLYTAALVRRAVERLPPVGLRSVAMLRTLRRLEARPGLLVDLQSVMDAWAEANDPDEFDGSLRELADAGLIEPYPPLTETATLTEAGLLAFR